MTITTETAPITVEQRETIKTELATAIARSGIHLPSAGCDNFTIDAVENSKDEAVKKALQQIPYAGRKALVAQAVIKAASLK